MSIWDHKYELDEVEADHIGFNENYLQKGSFFTPSAIQYFNALNLSPPISLLPGVQKVTKSINWEMSE